MKHKLKDPIRKQSGKIKCRGKAREKTQTTKKTSNDKIRKNSPRQNTKTKKLQTEQVNVKC